jgi:O-antigen/teichoic acid export membrane protein
MNSVLNAGLYLEKRSMAILGIMLFAVAIKIGMNIMLLPGYGVMGAAIATLVPCVLATLLSAFLSNKYIRIRIDLKDVLYYLLLSLCMFFIVKQIAVSTVWLSLLIKVFAGFMIISIGVLYREKEIVLFLKGKLKQL